MFSHSKLVGRHYLVLIAGASVLGACAGGSDADRLSAEAEIAAARDAFWRAHEQGDASGLAATFAEDGVLLAPGVDAVRGRAEIEAAARQMFTSMAISKFVILSLERALRVRARRVL